MTNMENLWIMAQAAETQGQSEVPAEPVGQNQTTTGTVASPDPNTSRPRIDRELLVDYAACFHRRHFCDFVLHYVP